MIYLVGENLFELNSGTEFSQLQRFKALKQAGLDVKIVLRNYNRMLGHALEETGLSQDDVINMYDFFQGTTQVERNEQNLRLLDSIPLTDYHINGIDNNHSLLQEAGKTIAEIHVMPQTIGLIGDIEYLDDRGNKAVGEYWDWRGFKSMVQNFHPNGSVGTQRFLNQNGETVIEVTHMNINGHLYPTMWKLFNYFGHNYVFDTENQLFTFFLNELNAQEAGTWVSDRRSVDESVLNVANPVKTVAMVHSITFNNFKHPKAGILPAYQWALNQRQQRFDQVAFPTEEQLEDVAKVVADHDNFTVAADAAVEPVSETRKVGDKIHLLYRGMLGTNRRLGDLVHALHNLQKKIPDAKLTLQGFFASQKEHNELTDLIKKLGLEKSVTLANYANDDEIYKDVTLFVNASDNEAYGISLLESMAHGVPVVSYAVPYLSNNLVKNDQNGILVTNRTPSELAKAIVKLVGDPKKYQQLSQGAIATAQANGADQLVKSWKAILKQN